MPAVIVVGLQWGDEGKGKVSYLLSRDAELAVRFQGGANAGHSVVINGRKLRFHMLPAGSAAGAKPCIASGVVVDVEQVLREVDVLKELGVWRGLSVSHAAQVTLEAHKIRDGLLENLRKERAVGTTRRGVGPAYADKALRVGIRVEDLTHSKTLEEKLSLQEKIWGKVEEDAGKLLELGKMINPYVSDVSEEVNDVLNGGGKIVFEGAQGTLLDIDHGTYPYVTSSNTVAGAACAGCGVGPTRIDEVIGVMKAYATRVGGGPFPTELGGELAEKLRTRGEEYGTTTGRPRRIGWLDLVALRYSISLNHTSWIALTKLDVLSGIEKLKIAVAYDVGRERVEYPTKFPSLVGKARLIYVEVNGWRKMSKDEWKKVAERGFDAFPEEAKNYVETIERLLDIKIKLVSVSEEIGVEVWR